MKKIMITVSAFLFSMVLTTGAFAAGGYGQPGQTDTKAQTGTTQMQQQRSGAPQTTAQFQVKSTNNLIGKAVKSSQGEDLGNVSDIMIDSQSGQVGFALVSTGGVLGMGEDQYIVPWNALKVDPQTDALTLNISKERLQQAPKGQTVSDRKQAQEIHKFYGVSPYWEGSGSKRMK